MNDKKKNLIFYRYENEIDEDYLKRVNDINRGTFMEVLGIVYTKVENGLVEGVFVVNENTRRMKGGILHGGASIAVAETFAGIGGSMLCEEGEMCVGVQISANHIGMANEGEEVFVRATAIHLGKRTNVWNVDLLVKERNKLISSVRVTNTIINNK